MDLPPLQQAVLDRTTLERLFEDLAAHAVIRAVRPRVPPSQEPPALTLAEAREGLLSGFLHGVQILYRHEGKDWNDTLLQTPSGVKLVRICEADIQASVYSEGRNPA